MKRNTLEDLQEKYEEPTFLERWRSIFFGVKQDKRSRPYKIAILELWHEFSKSTAFVVCLLAIAILLMWKTERSIPPPATVPVSIIDPEPPQVFDPPEDVPDKPTEVTTDFLDDLSLPTVDDLPMTPIEDPTPDPQPSVKPAFESTVSAPKSPILFSGLRAGPGGQKGGGGSGFGYGDGSALATDLVGCMVDLKQGDHSGLSFRKAVKELIDEGWSAKALSHYFVATNRLYLNYLFVEKQPAENGPTAFGCQDQVQPRKWVAHYAGHLNPMHSGEYRFIGHFDDLLIVMVDGKPVLDAYWQNRDLYRGGGRSEITGWKPDEKGELFDKHLSFSGQPLVHGDWVKLDKDCNRRIDIIIGEEPGGVVGGILLLEEKGVEYEKTPGGRPILPLFAMSRLEEFECAQVTNSMSRMNFQVEVDPIRLPVMNFKRRAKPEKKNANEVKVEVIRK